MLAKRETNLLDIVSQARALREFGDMIVKSGFAPSSVKTPEQAVIIMLKGAELGVPPMEALSSITVIQNKPTISPQLMLSLIRSSGLLEDIKVNTLENAVSVSMKRRGESSHSERFGKSEADAMQLSGKDNYKKQPLVMYKWRAIAACARVVFPDVISGMYTPDEMGADVQISEDGEMTILEATMQVLPDVIADAPEATQSLDAEFSPAVNPDEEARRLELYDAICDAQGKTNGVKKAYVEGYLSKRDLNALEMML